MDIDSIKAAAEDWKTKYEAAEADKAAMQHKHRLEGYVKRLGLRDDVYEAHVTKQRKRSPDWWMASRTFSAFTPPHA